MIWMKQMINKNERAIEIEKKSTIEEGICEKDFWKIWIWNKPTKKLEEDSERNNLKSKRT